MKRSKNTIGLQFSGFDELAERFDKLGGDLNRITQEALEESQKAVTLKISQKMNKSNLPAGGKYSTGQTEKSIIKDTKVDWQGSVASIDVGFEMKTPQGTSLTSIFLIYGTPRQKPVDGLYNALYGNKTKKEIASIQKNIFNQGIKDIMEGK